MKKANWNNRALTSLLSMVGFLIMSLTGLVLYVVPHGRIAYWVEWKFLGLTKEQWGDIHVLSMFLFLGAISFHIYFNWRPLIGYLKSRARKRLGARREFLVSLIVAIFFVVSGILELKPLGYLLDLEAGIKNSWIEGPDDEPPFGHAELLRLKALCRKSNIPLAEAIRTLKEKGLVGVEAGKPLVELARENGLSPRDVFRLIQHLEVTPPVAQPQGAAGMTVEFVEETFAGTGLGRKTMADIAAQVAADPAQIEERLKRKGITYEADQSLKQIATGNDLPTPLDVLKAMLVE